MMGLGWFPPGQALRFNKGGRVTPLGPQITITQVRAEHSSELTVTDPTTRKSPTYPAGEPCGVIVEVENGFKLYHRGDTPTFSRASFSTGACATGRVAQGAVPAAPRAVGPPRPVRSAQRCVRASG